MKTCITCGIEKLSTDFPKWRLSCKRCVNAAKKTPEKKAEAAARMRETRKDPEVQENDRKYAREYRAANLEECRRKRREYRKDNLGKEAAVQRTNRAKRVDMFDLLKLERPCYDCGGIFPPESMDWDHKPGTVKCFDVALGVTSYKFDRVVDEINKCQLVCACCHRVRTKARMHAKNKKGEE